MVVGALMPLRGAAHEEAIGMDIVHHGEEAYATGEGALLIRAEGAAEEERAVAGRV